MPAFPLPSRASLLALATVLLGACTGPSTPVAARLRFAVEPGNTAAGTTFTVVVHVVDLKGDLASTATNIVSLALGANPGNATLVGRTILPAVNGVATFSDLSLTKIGTGYTLTASSPSLGGAISAAFVVTAGPPAKLTFLSAPPLAISGVSLAAVTVAVQDASGNAATTPAISVSVSLGVNPGNATLSGVTTVLSAQGQASFSDLRIDKVGTGYTLTATGTGLVSANSNPIQVIAGPPAKLAFTLQPAGAPTGAPLRGVEVAVRDANDNPTTATNSITVALGANPGGATLTGSTTRQASSGFASFTDLVINNAGVGYTLTASSASLIGATSAPFTIRTALDFTGIGAGYFHACGLGTGALTYCWGLNNGQLGDGSTVSSSVPSVVLGGISLVTLSTGRDHSCGLTAGGIAYCWGVNSSGQLGDGTTSNRLAPTLVAGGLSFASISAGYIHTCALTLAGAPYCWGDNGNGAVGDATTVRRLVPTPVSGGLAFLNISAGRLFTCGTAVSHTAYCWGVNESGELGDGSISPRTAPVVVSGGLSFATVGAGGFHACGVTLSGATHCWGSNFSGQLGNGTNASSLTPVLVLGGLSFSVLTVGNRHNCGLTVVGTAHCWGDNIDFNLGDGTSTSRSTPVLVTGGLSFSRISAGRFHTCAVTTGNAGYCWGANFDGQLGDGTTTPSSVPIRVR